MIAWRFTFLFAFCSAFISKCSLGISTCSLDIIFDLIKVHVDDYDSRLVDLSYDDTLSLTKSVTSLYFNVKCGIPEYTYAYEHFSTCQVNKEVAGSVESQIKVIMEAINTAWDEDGKEFDYDQLVYYGNQIEAITKHSFQITYRYAPIHTLLCMNLILFRSLAVKIPEGGANSTASEHLTTALNECTNRFNDNEFEMVDTLNGATFKTNKLFLSSDFVMVSQITSEDQFTFYCDMCSELICDCSCVQEDNIVTYLHNPGIAAYKRVFNPVYCELRDFLSIFLTSSVVVGVQCHDANLYISQAFIGGDWYVRDKPDGELFGVYEESPREFIGIPIYKGKDSYYIDVIHKRVGRNGDVVCNNVTVLTRCDIDVPAPGGPCFHGRYV